MQYRTVAFDPPASRSGPAESAASALDTLIAILRELRNDLGDGQRLTEVFQRAAEWRQKLTG